MNSSVERVQADKETEKLYSQTKKKKKRRRYCSLFRLHDMLPAKRMAS
jgi:hypothetical protein